MGLLGRQSRTELSGNEGVGWRNRVAVIVRLVDGDIAV